jgi:predicted GNAT family acetyltransferase
MGEDAGLFLDSFLTPPAGWTVIETAPLLQMVHEGSEPLTSNVEGEELNVADVSQMVALAELTKPGPFGTRTRELGAYIGVRRKGRLVAMAGERLRVPGYTEVSAVCTHPEHLGCGYASALVAELMRRICSRGEVPFLHVRSENRRAIELYKRLGFTERLTFRFALLRRGQD